MNYGIGNNIIPPELQYAFDLQEQAKMQAAMARQQAMNPQPAVPDNNVVSQLEAGLSSAPAPNMQFASGGIVGYAQGGMPQQSAPAPAPQLDPELIAFIKALAAIQKEEETSFPEERDLIEQKRNLLLQNTSPRIKQMYSDLDTVPTFKKGGRVSLEDVMSDPENSAGIRAIMASLAQAGRDIAEFTGDEILAMLGSPVARGQNEVMSEVGRGAMGIAQDMMPDMPDVNIVENMARVGRAMPGSNLGDRPVRDAMAEGIASMAPGGTGTNVSPGLAAAQRRRDLRNANMGTADSEMATETPQRSLRRRNPNQNSAGVSGIENTAMSQAEMDARDLGIETGRGGLGELLSGIMGMFGGDESNYNPTARRSRRSGVPVQTEERSEPVASTGGRQGRRGNPGLYGDYFTQNEVAGSGGNMQRRGDPATTTPIATTAEPRLNDTSAELYESLRARPPSVRGGDLDISREQAFAGMFPNAQASVDDLARRKEGMRAAFPNAQAEADRYGEYRKTNPRQQPKTGISGILDKVADVATILGRGAGASKGYEGAKIVKESQRAREAQAKLDQDKLLRLLQFEQEDRRIANVRNTDQERYVRDYVQAQRDSGETTKTDAQLRAEGAREFRTIAPAYTASARSLADADKEVQNRLKAMGVALLGLTPEQRVAEEARIRNEVYRLYGVTPPATASTTPAATGPQADLQSFYLS